MADFILSSKLSKEKLLLLLNAAFKHLNGDVQYFALHPEALTKEESGWRESCFDGRHKELVSTLPNLLDVSVSSLAAFPLTMSIAQKTVADRCIIIGDAAHVIHPLAGQGVNLGIADARSLAAAIEKVASIGGDLGDSAHYHRYSKQRLAASMAMAGFCDGVHRIFDSSFPAPWLPTMGMQMFQNFTFLKSMAVKIAQL